MKVLKMEIEMDLDDEKDVEFLQNIIDMKSEDTEFIEDDLADKHHVLNSINEFGEAVRSTLSEPDNQKKNIPTYKGTLSEWVRQTINGMEENPPPSTYLAEMWCEETHNVVSDKGFGIIKGKILKILDEVRNEKVYGKKNPKKVEAGKAVWANLSDEKKKKILDSLTESREKRIKRLASEGGGNGGETKIEADEKKIFDYIREAVNKRIEDGSNIVIADILREVRDKFPEMDDKSSQTMDERNKTYQKLYYMIQKAIRGVIHWEVNST